MHPFQKERSAVEQNPARRRSPAVNIPAKKSHRRAWHLKCLRTAWLPEVSRVVIESLAASVVEVGSHLGNSIRTTGMTKFGSKSEYSFSSRRITFDKKPRVLELQSRNSPSLPKSRNCLPNCKMSSFAVKRLSDRSLFRSFDRTRDTNKTH